LEYRKGKQAIRNKRLALGIVYIKFALFLDSRNADYHYQLIYLQTKNRKLLKTARLLQEYCVDNFGTNARILALSGLIYHRAGQKEKAREEYLAALQMNSEFDPDIRTFELDKILIPNDAYVNVWSSEHSTIYASPSDHSRSGRAFRIEEKTTGKSIVFSGDSRPVSSIEKLSQKATLLVHEATFLEADSMLAQDFGHSTASDAAVIAQTADVSKLALIHFDLSDGHSVTEFKREASTKYQGEIIIPNDMDCIEI